MLTDGTAKSFEAARAKAARLIDFHTDEISPALRAELVRFLRLAESALLSGKVLDLDHELLIHEQRVAKLMQEGMVRTAADTGATVLADLDRSNGTRSWLLEAAVAASILTVSTPAAKRFAAWTGHHIKRVIPLKGEVRERALWNLRNVTALRRSNAGAEDVAHLSTQIATDSVALWSEEIDQRVWLSRLDGLERFTHNEAHAQHCPISGSFSVGGYRLRFPRDPRGPIHETAGCRCVTALRRRK